MDHIVSYISCQILLLWCGSIEVNGTKVWENGSVTTETRQRYFTIDIEIQNEVIETYFGAHFPRPRTSTHLT
jgi:hypothetical protein